MIKKAIEDKLIKKFDPYKAFKKDGDTDELVEYSKEALKDSVEYDEKGNIKVDEAGKPIFKGFIQWRTDRPQLEAIWTCCKAALHERLVPENELDAAHDTMMLYAKEHRDSGKRRNFMITVPINYFVGTWHLINTCRKFRLFEEEGTKFEKKIDELAMWFAEQIDMYHEVKRMEKVQNEASPDDVLKLPRKENNNKFQNLQKALTFKK